MDSKTAEIRHEYAIYVDWQYGSRVSDFDTWFNQVKVAVLITAAEMMGEDESIQTAQDAKDYLLELADAIKEK